MKIKQIKQDCCPICGNTDLDYSIPEFTDLTHLKQEISCDDCEFIFYNLFELKFLGQEGWRMGKLKVGQDVDWDD